MTAAPPSPPVPPPPRPITKALNVLMLKLLENCNRNSSFAALLSLLVEAPPAGTATAGEGDLDARWSDLVVKCLIKITKALPATIDVSRPGPGRCPRRGGRGRGGGSDPHAAL